MIEFRPGGIVKVIILAYKFSQLIKHNSDFCELVFTEGFSEVHQQVFNVASQDAVRSGVVLLLRERHRAFLNILQGRYRCAVKSLVAALLIR